MENSQRDGGGTSPAYRNYVLGLLTLIYTVDIVDRQILTILMQPIKLELGLSDSQLAIAYGLGYALFFGLFSLPIAMWADRRNRRNIIALAVTIFSAMTVLTGIVHNFWQLLLARFGVAIGGTGSAPLAHSVISDLFPAEKRGTAIGIHMLANNIGMLVGLLVGGWVNQFYGWRAAFFCVGLPGLLIGAVVYFTMREPVRGQADGLTAEGAADAPPLREVFRLLWAQRSFRHIAIGTTLAVTGGTSAFVWLSTFLIRSFDMQTGEVGTALAVILGVVGSVGTFLSGKLADVLGKRDIRWNLWLVTVAYVVIFPFFCAAYLAETKWLCLALLLYPGFAAAANMAPAFTMTQSLVTVRMRTQAAAILWMFVNVLAAFIGPQLTGILSDIYNPHFGQESLRYALLTGAITWLWAALHFYLGARTLKEDVARVHVPRPA